MRRLETRLGRLERRSGRENTVARDAMRTGERLAAVAAHIRADGDFADTPNASPAERYVRAVLRGDDATAAEIIKPALN